MSVPQPIIAVTGSAAAGTLTVKHAFADIIRRGIITLVVAEGAGAVYHRNNV